MLHILHVLRIKTAAVLKTVRYIIFYFYYYNGGLSLSSQTLCRLLKFPSLDS